MSVIYEPRGKAREYSPLALNLYLHCTHGCKYCYAPSAIQKGKDEYFSLPNPRKNILASLEKELKKDSPKKQVLLSFIGDVYSETSDVNATTRRALEMLLQYKVPIAVLTKGGKRCLQDMDIFKAFAEHIQVGATLTFLNLERSMEWESGAACPEERLQALKELHDQGVKTFASFEPVIEPSESLALIKRTLEDDSVDVYKIGKLNNYHGLDKNIDWNGFLLAALELLRPKGKRLYVKHDLRVAANQVKLYGGEVLPDEYCVS
jgi:DNA repair photolyase